MENTKLTEALNAFKKQYPNVTSSDIQAFIIGWQANEDAKTIPSEDVILDTIIDSVFIRGIELEYYRRNFTNEQSGLYDRLLKLFNIQKNK